MKYTYTARREENGETYRGVASAKDRFELYAYIRREGGAPISVQEDTGSSPLSFSYWNVRFATVPEHDKIIFAHTLAAMLKAGLALSRALSVLERQNKNAKFSYVLSQVGSDVRRGETLHASLAKFPNTFSRLFISMVRAGEESGDVSGALQVVSDQMDRMYALGKKVRGALIYPAIILIAIFGIGILMMVEVVPTLAATFEELGTELPASTQAVIGLSNMLVEHTVSVILGAILAICGIVLALRTDMGRRARDTLFLRMPLIGNLVKELNAARTARTLSSLLSSGVDVISAISITHDVVQNSYFKEILKKAESGVQRGELLSKPFAANERLYPPLVGEMIAVGEETGDLPGMLTNLAVFYEEEVSRKTKDMSTIIEPFLMILIGAAVGFFAISMVQPIYSLSEAI